MKLQYRIKNRLKKHSIDMDCSNKSTIFIAGMGRSGTTWLSELINYKQNYRDIFEPFLPYKVKISSSFKYLQYLNPNYQDSILTKSAKTILSGQFKSEWTDVNKNRLVTNKRIIKDIRANLMLKWLSNIRPGMPILLLIRHPLAVIDSYKNLGWGIEAGGKTSDFDRIIEQKQLLDDFPIVKNSLKYIDTTDYISQLLYLWCVLYHVPLKQLSRADYKIVFYENILLHPQETLSDIFSYISQRFDGAKILDKIKKPSITNYRQTDFTVNPTENVQKWKKTFNKIEITKSQEILKRFELDYLYDTNGFPT
ncbi:sulfotransferase [bacterium]|nr:sulfotransferase [bacterium]